MLNYQLRPTCKQIRPHIFFLVDLELQNKNKAIAQKERKPMVPIIMAWTHLMTSQISSLPKKAEAETVSRQTVSKQSASSTDEGYVVEEPWRSDHSNRMMLNESTISNALIQGQFMTSVAI